MTDLEEIVKEAVASLEAEWTIIYPQKNKQKALLITCMTGIGTAVHMSELLEKSLPANSALKIIPYEYQVLTQRKLTESVFSMYDVIGIIGTTNPQIDTMPYLSLESLISGEKMDELVQWLAPIFSLKTKLTLISNLSEIFH